MASSDSVLGLLYVDNLTAVNSFTDEDLQFLVAFSGLAAIGIKNSRYADQLQREAMVRSNFERYFALNVAAEIAQHQAAIKLGGERRIATVRAMSAAFSGCTRRARKSRAWRTSRCTRFSTGARSRPE